MTSFGQVVSSHSLRWGQSSFWTQACIDSRRSSCSCVKIMCLRSAPWSGLMTLEPLVVAVATGVSSFANFAPSARRPPVRAEWTVALLTFSKRPILVAPMRLRVAFPIAAAAGLLTLIVLGGSGAVAAPSCQGRSVTIPGTEGDDTIEGTKSADVIEAGAGDDTIESLGGNDTVCAGEGND